MRLIEFAKVDSRLRRGDLIGTTSIGIYCLTKVKRFYEDIGDVVTDAYADVFRQEMRRAGFNTVGDAGNMFESTPASAEYAIGGAIISATADLCAPRAALNMGDYRGKGQAVVGIEWQIYSRLRREVVARVQTTGAADKQTLGNVNEPMNLAFAENVKGLINAKAFRDLIIGGASTPAAVAAAPAASPGGAVGHPTIDLTKPSRKPESLGEMAGSVLTVFAGDGHGSGVLISDQGYVVTNQHVTAGAKYVKLRWSDNFETVGEVLREDKGRDVALIKTDARGRLPLALRRAPPELGQEVYAIGSPLDEKLSGTVTRGIVSASNRIYEGYSWIQSDVTVNPGNSGGPLVTREGEVVGLTDIGLRPDGAPSGINLFIPAGDAMDFLGLR